MSIYTKNGDRGITNLIRSGNVSKADDRINLVGTVDELTSHLGLVKVMLKDQPDTVRILEKVQRSLILLMAGIADPYNKEYRVKPDETEILESEIDRMEGLFDRPKEFILPGGCRLSAELDIARTVCRRAERALASVTVKFGSDQGSRQYLNRLADYLYILARYTDARREGRLTGKDQDGSGMGEIQNTSYGNSRTASAADTGSDGFPAEKPAAAPASASDAVVAEVMKRIGLPARMNLKIAKRLIEKIEEEAKREGKAAVIAVCNPQGNPVAVHVMDDAFLVSFDVAMKKAYTSVAVKMSTMELSRIAQPGGTFYGVDKMDGGKIVIFGGGVPLVHEGMIIGGLGVSGGTGEEDHHLAEYGLSVLPQILREEI